MNLDLELEKAIPQVLKNHPTHAWVQEIKKRVPGADIAIIQEYIMIYSGGDVIEIDADISRNIGIISGGRCIDKASQKEFDKTQKEKPPL